VRAPTWVGDIVMATPALRALRARNPDAEIVVSGRAYTEDLLRGLASVDRFVSEPGRALRAVLAHARALRRERFDQAVLLPDSARAALPAFLARIPVRCGYARDPLRRLLVNRALEVPSESGGRVPISMVERYLRVTRVLGCPDAGERTEIGLDDDARARTGARLAASGVGAEDALLVVTPGAAFGASKLWPAEHFAAACDGITDRLGLRTVIAPGPGEEPVAREIEGLMKRPVQNLVDPTLSLRELSALIERSRLLLSNDTGPRSMAVALDRPVVVLMGPTDPRHTHHLMERQRVLREPVDCSPCHLKVCPIDHRCMTRLSPERAVEAAAELLA
jgi:heptosyltransferase-2